MVLYPKVVTRSLLPGSCLQALAVAMASMAFGRVLGAAFERDLSLYPTWAFVMVELLLAAALAAAGAVFSSG